MIEPFLEWLPDSVSGWFALVASAAALLISIRAERRASRAHIPMLEVTPVAAWSTQGTPMPDVLLGIEVVNHSLFPVTIEDVGFHYEDSSERWAFINPFTLNDTPWPRRLEVQETETFYISANRLRPEQLRRLKCAYARTSTRTVSRGNSKALKRIKRDGALPERSPVPIVGTGLYITRDL